MLDGLDTKNVMLSSQLVETLYSYDLIEPPDDEDSVLARIAAVLANPEDEDARQWAYSIVSNQFEDVVAGPYVAAIEKLTADERTALFTMAALGSPSYGFWNDWLLKELIKSADPLALPAFEHWASDLYTDNAMTQEVISCYTLAVQGWTQFIDSPPKLVNAETGDRAAWECYGAIIFWLCRPGLTAGQIAERDRALLATAAGRTAPGGCRPALLAGARQPRQLRRRHSADRQDPADLPGRDSPHRRVEPRAVELADADLDLSVRRS